nr:hypothetical protein [Halopiger aswanensis]
MRIYCDCHTGEAYTVDERFTNTVIRYKVAVVEAVRDAVGYDVDLSFDCH